MQVRRQARFRSTAEGQHPWGHRASQCSDFVASGASGSHVESPAARLEARAAALGRSAVRRVEILRLRFEEDLPIREIARLWSEDAARLHHEYARAREEFHRALLDVVAEDHPGTPAEMEEEAQRLLRCLA